MLRWLKALRNIVRMNAAVETAITAIGSFTTAQTEVNSSVYDALLELETRVAQLEIEKLELEEQILH